MLVGVSNRRCDEAVSGQPSAPSVPKRGIGACLTFDSTPADPKLFPSPIVVAAVIVGTSEVAFPRPRTNHPMLSTGAGLNGPGFAHCRTEPWVQLSWTSNHGRWDFPPLRSEADSSSYYLALQTVVEAKNGTLAKRLTLAPTTAAIGPAREAAIYGQFILMNPDLLGRQV
jgi:hypothetical protein